MAERLNLAAPLCALVPPGAFQQSPDGATPGPQSGLTRARCAHTADTLGRPARGGRGPSRWSIPPSRCVPTARIWMSVTCPGTGRPASTCLRPA